MRIEITKGRYGNSVCWDVKNYGHPEYGPDHTGDVGRISKLHIYSGGRLVRSFYVFDPDVSCSIPFTTDVMEAIIDAMRDIKAGVLSNKLIYHV